MQTFKMITRARWIWPKTQTFDIRNEYALFRRGVVLSSVPDEAPVLITADQSYQLYVNGYYVCRGPARGYQRSWPYDEVDIAQWLHCGQNVIAVRAYNPGFGTFQYRFEGFAGFLFMGRIGEQEVVSDKSWRCRIQEGILRDSVPSTVQLFPQEHVDARVERDDWMRPEFDDSGWGVVGSDVCWNSLPWFSLEPRGIPMLEERFVWPQRVVAVAEGTSVSGWDSVRNVVDAVRAEPAWHHRASKAETEGMLPVIRLQGQGSGSFVSVLLDFGHTVVGSLRLQVRGATGEEVIDAVFSETVFSEENGLRVNLDPVGGNHVSLGSRLVCGHGETDHLFFHPYGFRYLVLRLRNAHHALEIEPSLLHIGYPLKVEGHFDSSDETLCRIWRACLLTQKVCSLDAYVDTPWREQAQWWGDARVQAWNTFHLVDDPRLLRRGIRSIAGQITPDGLTYGHAPTIAHHCVLPDFTLIWIITLWDYYWQTGSLDAFTEHEAVLKGALEYFAAHTNAQNGLVAYDERYWLFLDWSNLDRGGCPSLLSLWLLIALVKCEQMYALLGNRDQAEKLSKWAEKLRTSIEALRRADGLIGDGYAADGSIIEQASVHTQTLALEAGLSVCADTLLAKSLLPFIRESADCVAKPSVYWMTYIFSVLDTNGYGDEVVDYIRKHWAQMADHGTTWSQLREYGGTQSHSHAWSAHPLYHLMQILGGIRQIAARWDRVVFRPLLRGQHGSIKLPTPHGLICTSWDRIDNGQYKVRLHLPSAVSAVVMLPGVESLHTATEGEWIVDVPDAAL